MKSMGWENNHDPVDNRVGFSAGVIGGIVQYFLNIHLEVDFWSKLLQAVLTAGLCGFVGIAGKELFVVLKDSLKEYFKSKKK